MILRIILVGALVVVGRDSVAAESCVAAGCHATLMTAKNTHAPAEDCSTCHESTEARHPQKGKKTFKLAQEPPELCMTCHDAIGTKSDVHPPVKEGMCTTCHDPHASNEEKLLVSPMKELCTACHDDKAGLPHMHGPAEAGNCMACHAAHESDIKPLLVKKDDDLCAGCHVEMKDVLQKPHVHPALEGGCVSCHNPHGSEHAKLLAEDGAKLCVTCHDDVGEKIEKGPAVHAPVRGAPGCVSCHDPHAAVNAKLLRAPEKDTCLGCHKAIVPANATVVHAPVKAGECARCHDPHASANAKLLTARFPAGPYVPYADDEYALCFSCHTRDLLAYPDTSFATGFRDGERNLHYLHVRKNQKGRSCRMCHEMHASRAPKLIADAVPFGTWSLPLKFVKTETGGSCAPGCHKPQTYDRKKS